MHARLNRNLAMVLFAASLAASLGACSDRRTGGHGDGGTAAGPPPGDLGYDPDAFFLTDPPPATCALDGTKFPPPPAPGGTPDCPDDKNRAGCPCPTQGMTAPCWPGLRVNRGLGICKDGVATCIQQGEFNPVWSDCVGYVLPEPGATDGAAACKCFSHGTWKIDNVSPCFIGSPAGSQGAVSTMNGSPPACPADPTMAPPGNWSPDTVTTDCAGHFKLCYSIKAGDFMAPKATDCVVASVCTEGDYTQPNMAQMFPPLASWHTTSAAQATCATQFAASGGYGEMSVDGLTVACDTISSTFNRIPYCPISCSTNPSDPMCAMCQSGQSGNF
jgi:hypothetical protein